MTQLKEVMKLWDESGATDVALYGAGDRRFCAKRFDWKYSTWLYGYGSTLEGALTALRDDPRNCLDEVVS